MEALLVILLVTTLRQLHRAIQGTERGEEMSISLVPLICSLILLAMWSA